MVNRVKGLNTQNKILLGMQSTPLKLLDNAGTTALVKMTDGYGLAINDKALVALHANKSVEHSLLGFVDKLRSNKIFPDGENCLKYVMFDAKMNVIRRIAQGESILQPIHLLALYLYTSNYTIFKQVNANLENWNASSVWNPFIYCLYQGIKLLPTYTGEVYRAIDIEFDPIEYAIGNQVNWNTFSLCSYEWKNSSDLINKKTGIVFVFKSATGRKINKYSKYPVDAEVVFLPETKFIVTNHYVADIICLGQANIRDTTFKIKDEYYEKVASGKSSIIVELTEIYEGTAIEDSE